MLELSFSASDLSHYPSPRQVVLGELDFHAVARQKPDPIPLCRSGSMRQNLRLVSQLEPVQQARQFFHYNSLNRHGLRPFAVPVILSPPAPGFALMAWSRPKGRSP